MQAKVHGRHSLGDCRDQLRQPLLGMVFHRKPRRTELRRRLDDHL